LYLIFVRFYVIFKVRKEVNKMELVISKKDGEVIGYVDWEEDGNGEDFMEQCYDIMESLKK